MVDKGKYYNINQKILLAKPKRKEESINKSGFKLLFIDRLDIARLSVPDSIPVEQYKKLLEDSGEFEIVEYNVIYKSCSFSPNDPGLVNQWYLERINIYNAWDIVKGNPNIKIAVIENDGIDCYHPDLGMGTDGYTNVNVLEGYNYVNGTTTHTLSDNKHGTMVAGIIAAKTNNQNGIAGITGGNNCVGTHIVPYQTGGDDSSIILAIEDAVDKGVKVINMSFGGSYSSLLENALEDAYLNGVTMVCASGNDGYSDIMYPASSQYTIAVGATNENNQKWSYSNYGTGLDLVAPGINIYSTALNNGYSYYEGTSFAAPQVTGVIALMLAVNSTLNPEGIRSILRNTAQKITGYTFSYGWNSQVGYGLLDAYASVVASIVGFPFLSGPTSFCSNEEYYISNFPSVCTINWSVSSNCAQIIAGQGTGSVTLQRNFDGWATLTATISYNGTVIKTLSKEIMVGTPSPSMVVYPISADGEWGYWRSDLHGNKIEVDGYSGNYPSYVVDLYRINNDFSIGQQVGHWTRNSLDNMTFGYYPPGWYYIEIVGVNDCGTSSPVGTEIESVDGSWRQPRMFSFNYHQGSEMLTVTLNPALGSRQAVSSCEIQLWNGNTMLRKFRMTDEKLQIPMSGMKGGLYIIRAITDDGKSQQQKLMKK